MRSRSGHLLLSGAVVATLLAGATPGRACGQDGEAIFKTTCVACHTIGGGRLVGPDLAGVQERRSEDWFIAFVQRSQSVIASGDPEAVALSQEYPGLVMPDWPLSDAEARAVLAYIAQGAAQGAAPTPVSVGPPSKEDADLGRHLFQGTTRLVNGGPSCNSCHEVTNDAVIGGGVLAIELTAVFTRLGGPGVRAVVGSPPFPVMQRAYQGRPLTEVEVEAVVAFLQQADAEQAFHQPRDYGMGLFTAGVTGAALLLGLYSLVWRGRRRGSVNAGIYARQVRST
ncbi:MAG: cytochrome c [Longimicrobiales bacterium]|nr:cytochrome c [Longimicrobiales bacterium]